MLVTRRSLSIVHHLRQVSHISMINGQLNSTRVLSTSNGLENANKYQSAILRLNELQSNAATIAALREKRTINPEENVQLTTMFLQHTDLYLEEIDKLKVIHVSGTKGKGSTCAFVESILRSLGYKTGLYTSPHLVHVRERIRINSKPIDEDLFAEYFFRVYNQLKAVGDGSHMPAYFKFLTLMAFNVFKAENVDVAIIEVGIGGRYDCTNIIKNPKVCGITTLDYDHTLILGSTIEEIAYHKVGIIKEGVPTVVTTPIPSALEVFRQQSKKSKSPLILSPTFSSYQWPAKDVTLGIAGQHQQGNASLALQLVRIWLRETGNELNVFSDSKWNYGEAYEVPQRFVEAMESCRWPGRCQIVDKGLVKYYLDGAHTPKSMEMCGVWFEEQMKIQPRRRRMLIFQCTADRNPTTLLPFLKNLDFDLALFCPTILHISQDKRSDAANFNQSTSDQMTRSRLCAKTWNELSGKETKIFDCVSSLLSWVEMTIDEPTDILVTGSLHLVGGVLSSIFPDV